MADTRALRAVAIAVAGPGPGLSWGTLSPRHGLTPKAGTRGD